MIQTLRARYDALAEREQRMVLVGGGVALLLLLLAVVLPFERGVSKTAERVARKQADLGWMQQMAPTLAAAPRSAPATQESLIVIVDRSAREAGLGQALTGSQPSGNGALRTTFEKAEFNRLVEWIALLGRQYGVQADTASFDTIADMPGTVNALVTLRLP